MRWRPMLATAIFTLLSCVLAATLALAAGSIEATQVWPRPNVLGWNQTPVTVTFVCRGQRVGPCHAPVEVSLEGARQTVGPVSVSIDLTAPTVTLTRKPAKPTTTA